MTWDIAISSKQTDSAYEAFPNKFTSEKFVVTVKWKTLKKPVDNTINCKIFKNKAKAIWKIKSKSYKHEIIYKNYSKLSRK